MSVLSSPTTHNDRQLATVRKPPGLLDRVARSAVLAQLRQLEQGRLRLRDGDAEHFFGNEAADTWADIEVLDPRFYREVMLGGSLGAGDAYVQGLWRSDDLLAVIHLFARHLGAGDLQQVSKPVQWLSNQLYWLLNRNSRKGSRRNIARHYDLSNDFFALFLDPTMTYSCGMFGEEQTTLKAASLAKYETICKKLDLQRGDHVVEIGCGWGGFAEYAAYHYGCRVTGITISERQLEFAKERIVRAGLQDRVELLLCDYRDMTGQFDKLVSIEMIEAVGHEYLDAFFSQCESLLKPSGRMLLQAITIPQTRYDSYRRRVDFIQKYIFPGGCLTSLEVINEIVGRLTDMRISSTEDFAADYARTLLMWRERFQQAADEIERMGFDASFRRTWDYYFCYCAAGFMERQIGVAQLLLERARGS